MGNPKNNSQRIYSQAEYEHYCFAQEPFSGFVEGIGYTCTEIVVTAQAINRSGTEFMYDISYMGYTFDMSDMWEEPSTLRELEANKENPDGPPDRSDYWQIPTFDKAGYRDDGWKYIQNPIAFVNNVAADAFNSIIGMANALVGSSQVMYHEGLEAWCDFEWGGFKNDMKGIGNWGVGVYNYHTQTPAGQQWEDFKRDISNIENWESSTAFVGTMFAGGYGAVSKAGTLSRTTGMLNSMPARAASINNSFSLNPRFLLKREHFKIHLRISNPGQHGVGILRQGQLDVGHRASTFFSTEVIQTGKIGIENYRTIYFNKRIGNRDFSVGINPWTRTIFHEGPDIYVPKKKP